MFRDDVTNIGDLFAEKLTLIEFYSEIGIPKTLENIYERSLIVAKYTMMWAI